MKKFSIFFLILIAGTFIFAGGASADFPNFGQNGLVTCSGAALEDGKGLKQCTSFCDILATGKNIIEFIVTIALFIAAPIFLLVGGIMLVAGGANPGLHSKGVAYIKTTIIGIIIVLLSYAIVNTFIGALGIGEKIKGFGNPLECSSGFLSVKTAYAETLKIDVSLPYASSSESPIDIIAGFYSFALAISGVLAVAVILFGAVKYMASPGSPSGQSEAREWITSALLGILLLGGAYLILNTINPELTILRLPTLEKIGPNTPRSGPPPLSPGAGTGSHGYEGVAIPTGTYSDADARKFLSAAGINVNKQNCQTENSGNCTSLSGIQKGVIEEVIKLKNNCRAWNGSCEVVVTAGTESGHSATSRHRIGGNALDIRLNNSLTRYIEENLISNVVANVTCEYASGSDGNRYRYETTACAEAAHWHVEF